MTNKAFHHKMGSLYSYLSITIIKNWPRVSYWHEDASHHSETIRLHGLEFKRKFF